MIEEKRERRRRDLQRMKAKARRIYPHDQKARLAEHLAACSCFLCRSRDVKISEERAKARTGEDDG